MEIKSINSRLITLVEFDQIPFSKILHSSNLLQIQNHFSFENVEIRPNPQNQPVIIFMIGLCKSESKECVIKRIEIEERKIIIEVDGSSSETDMIFSDLTNVMLNVSGGDKINPIVQSRESTLIVKMDFSASKLVNPRLLEFVNTRVTEEANIEQGTAIPNLHSVVFRLDYMLTDEKLLDYRISLARKEFTLGPREGTSLDEQIFISAAPVNTEVHIELLKEIESMFL